MEDRYCYKSGIYLEVIQETNKHAEEARKILEEYGRKVDQAKAICPELSSLHVHPKEPMHPETLKHLNNGEAPAFDKEKKCFNICPYHWSPGGTFYWFYASSNPAENEIPETFEVVIDGETYTVNH